MMPATVREGSAEFARMMEGLVRAGRGLIAVRAPTARRCAELAEMVAAALGGRLERVPAEVYGGRYIGETEKNLDRVLDAAPGTVLFFDEADALFGKRTGVRDSHDRYANAELARLWKRLERHAGFCVLAMAGRALPRPPILTPLVVVEADAEAPEAGPDV